MGSKNKRKDVPEAVTDTRKDTYDWIQCLISALIICVLLFVFVIRVVDVRGTSMWPTLQNGDKMLVSDLFYKPKQGDIVVLYTPPFSENDELLVKRVIAVEGQEVNIDFANGLVYVDGEVIEEAYINEATQKKLDFIGPQTVPEGCVFVMGDNRGNSNDSRAVGPISRDMIVGHVRCVLWPLNKLGTKVE